MSDIGKMTREELVAEIAALDSRIASDTAAFEALKADVAAARDALNEKLERMARLEVEVSRIDTRQRRSGQWPR